MSVMLSNTFVHETGAPVSRSHRLLALLQLLRRHRYPISAQLLATELQISVRTVYRDIATLQQQGAEIEGEAGIGYLLRPGFMLPPLMFSQDELEALVLGQRWVSKHGDPRLASAANDALAKIAAVLPESLREALDANALLVGSAQGAGTDLPDLALIRQAIRSQRKLLLHYQDGHGTSSKRTVWPVALGYFDNCRVLAAWCELRQQFRHFRTDRMLDSVLLEQRYPQRRQQLLLQWRREHQIPPP